MKYLKKCRRIIAGLLCVFVITQSMPQLVIATEIVQNSELDTETIQDNELDTEEVEDTTVQKQEQSEDNSVESTEEMTEELSTETVTDTEEVVEKESSEEEEIDGVIIEEESDQIVALTADSGETESKATDTSKSVNLKLVCEKNPSITVSVDGTVVELTTAKDLSTALDTENGSTIELKEVPYDLNVTTLSYSVMENSEDGETSTEKTVEKSFDENNKVTLTADEVKSIVSDTIVIDAEYYKFLVQMYWESDQDGIVIEDLEGSLKKEDDEVSFSLNGNTATGVCMDFSDVAEAEKLEVSFEEINLQGLEIVDATLESTDGADTIDAKDVTIDSKTITIENNSTSSEEEQKSTLEKLQAGYYILKLKVEAPNTFTVTYTKTDGVKYFSTKLNPKYGNATIEEGEDGKGYLVVEGKNGYYVTSAESTTDREWLTGTEPTYEEDSESSVGVKQVIIYKRNSSENGSYERTFAITLERDETVPEISSFDVKYKDGDNSEDAIEKSANNIFVTNNEKVTINIGAADSGVGIDKQKTTYTLNGTTYSIDELQFSLESIEEENELEISIADYYNNVTKVSATLHYDGEAPVFETDAEVQTENIKVVAKKSGDDYWMSSSDEAALLLNIKEKNEVVTATYSFYKVKDGNLSLVGTQNELELSKVSEVEDSEYAQYRLNLDLTKAFGDSVTTLNDIPEEMDGVYVIKATFNDITEKNESEEYELARFEINKKAPTLQLVDKINENDWVSSPSEKVTVTVDGEFYSDAEEAKYYYAITEAYGKQIDEDNIERPDKDDWIAIADEKITENSESGVVEAKNLEFELSLDEYGAKDGTVQFYLWLYDETLDKCAEEPIIITYNIDNVQPNIDSISVSENLSIPERIYRYIFGTALNKEDKLTFSISATDTKADKAVYLENNQPAIDSVSLYYIASSSIDDETFSKMSVAEQYQWLQKNNVKAEEIEASEKKDGTYTVDLSFAQDNKFYTLYVAATDLAGNITVESVANLTEDQDESSISQIMVDSKKPKITTALQSGIKADYTETRDGKEYNWYSGSNAVAYDITVQDNQSGIFSVDVEVNGDELKKDSNGTLFYDANSFYKNNKADEMELETELTYVVNLKQGKLEADGEGKVTVEVVDNAGNTKTTSNTVYVDEDAPVITHLEFDTGSTDTLDTVPTQYGYFFQKATTVTVYATDYIGTTENIGSGVAKMGYQLISSDGSVVTSGNLDVTAKKNGIYVAQFTVPEGFKGQIQVNAIDNVGQDSGYYNPKGAVVETAEEHKTTSEVKMILPDTTYADAEGNPLYTSDITLQFVAADSRSGLSESSWAVKSHYAAEAMTAGTLQIASVFDEASKTWSSSLGGDSDGWNIPNAMDLNLVTSAQKNVTISANENHIVANLSIKDNAGNTSDATEKVFSIDKTAPVVTVEYDNNNVLNEKYYQEKRVATITVVDANFSEDNCTFEITGPTANISGWTHHAASGCDGTVHTSDCYYTCQVEFVEDGDYTFNFYCTDRAGHTAGMASPDEFTIDTELPVISVSYDNNTGVDNYYNAARTATIEITDKNFDPAATQVDVTAALEDAAITTPQVSAFTQNGDVWSAHVDFASDGDYSLHVTSTDQAGNVAEEYALDEFTVDTTMPEVTITGVEDHSANNGTITPVIQCSDINMNSESLSVSLTGSNNGATAFESTKTITGNDVTVSIADLAHTSEMDDLYTLEVSVMDQAGNETVESILFSVNRFGSVYVIDDATKNLVDEFYTNEEQDVIITEINVDILQYAEIDYSLDGDIVTLEKDEDYTVNSKTEDGSWKMYEYCIDKENFEKEGSYVVSIYSEDLAQNKSSNKAKGDELAFVIDKTAPTIVIAGIEDNGQYMDAKRNVTIDTQDNILLDNVEVYVKDENQASANQDQLLENDGQISLSIDGSNQSQELYVVAKDAAGNIAVSDSVRFLITKNLFVQWYSNVPLCVGSSAAVVGVTGLVTFRKKIWRKKQVAN